MSREMTPMDLITHKNEAVEKLDTYITNLIASVDPAVRAKADKLSFWIKDYVKFLSFEPQFKANSYKRYKRGDVIKIHLGYNIGSEEGGLHYAVVLENNNSVHSPTITILPLTSAKPHLDVNNLGKGRVNIGNEIFTSLCAKVSAQLKSALDEQAELSLLVKASSECGGRIEGKIEERAEKLKHIIKQIYQEKREIQKMKVGSIALINQITTVSKIRIYDPKKSSGVLSGIRLSTITLDLINQALVEWMIYIEPNITTYDISDQENKGSRL